MSICMCKIFHKRGKFSNAQLSYANFEIRRGADEVGFGRGPAETRVEGVISLRHCRGTPPSPRHAPEEERERGRREGCQGCQGCSNEGVHRPVRVDPLHAAATVRPRDQSLPEDSECSLVYVPDDADPRRPPSPKHRTQHSKYELNDMRRRCEEL